MRSFITKRCRRLTRRLNIGEKEVCEAFTRVRNRQIDADLGGGVFKQLVARPGGGRSRGFRMIVALTDEGHAVAIYVYAKSKKANINAKELKWSHAVASMIQSLDRKGLNHLRKVREIIEVKCND